MMSELPHLERKLHTYQVILWLRRSFQHVEPHNDNGGTGESGADEQEEITISKEALYQAYVAMCRATDASPLFSRPVVGKMVKRAFPTIQTRRRGPRANVKQHWIGLRQLTDDELLLSDYLNGASHEDSSAQPAKRAHTSPLSSASSTSSSTTPEPSPYGVPSTTNATGQAETQPAADSNNNPSSQPPQPSLAGHNRMGPPQPYTLPYQGSDPNQYHQMRWQLEQQRQLEEELNSLNHDCQQPPMLEQHLEPAVLPYYELSPPVASEISRDYVLPLRQTTSPNRRHHQHHQQPLPPLPPQPLPPQPHHQEHHHIPAHNSHHSPRPPRERPGQSTCGERRRAHQNVWAERMIGAMGGDELQEHTRQV